VETVLILGGSVSQVPAIRHARADGGDQCNGEACRADDQLLIDLRMVEQLRRPVLSTRCRPF
jgi:hypothetical protein